MGKYRYINLISQFTNLGFFLKCTEIPDPFMSFHTKNLWHLQTLKNRNLLPWWPVITWSNNLWKLPKCMVRFCEFSHRWTLGAGSSKPLGKLISSQKKKNKQNLVEMMTPPPLQKPYVATTFSPDLVETTEKVFPHLVQLTVYGNFCGVVFRDSLITDWLVGPVLPLRIYLSFSCVFPRAAG